MILTVLKKKKKNLDPSEIKDDLFSLKKEYENQFQIQAKNELISRKELNALLLHY